MANAYTFAVDQLYGLGHELANARSAKFDLAQVRVLLAALGDPQRRFRSVLIAGTNGKGSTAATLASILQAAGHRTALYTSPHLLKVNERIQVDGKSISDLEFAGTYARVETTAQRLTTDGKLPWHPSFFEMLTAMAFIHFAESSVEIAVLEVGMGGRLDATNVVDPLVSVITDIAMDHEIFLGHSIAEIAGEKAGIIHPGGVVVTLPQHPEANRVIGAAVLERGATAISAAGYVPPVSPGAPASYTSAPDAGTPNASLPTGARGSKAGDSATARTRYPLEVMGEQILVDSPLLGRHQLRNLALAIATAEQLKARGITILPRHISEGIRQTRWPARFEVRTADAARHRPEIVVDVAHNPAGAWALRSALSERYAERPMVLVFGVLRDKAVREIAEILFPLARQVIVGRPDNPRAASFEEIREVGGRICSNIRDEGSVSRAVSQACALAGEDAVVVITGSIYTVGEALAVL
jgi:dihydrofolate synthase/folylpolyglutamate synthase